MSGRFYAAWALAVLLALVLPIAIPYAIWPDDESRCARYAKGGLGEEHRIPYAPVSVRVLDCPDDDVPRFRAEVTYHGPYGLPLNRYLVSSSDTGRKLNSDTDFYIAVVSYLGGVAGVSTPFAFFWLRHTLKKQQRFAA